MVKPLCRGVRYTDEANKLSDKIRSFLEPVFRQLSDEHYSLRDAVQIASDAVEIAYLLTLDDRLNSVESFKVLKRQYQGEL